MAKFLRTHDGGWINASHIALVAPDGMSIQTAEQVGTRARLFLAEPFNRVELDELDELSTLLGAINCNLATLQVETRDGLENIDSSITHAAKLLRGDI